MPQPEGPAVDSVWSGSAGLFRQPLCGAGLWAWCQIWVLRMNDPSVVVRIVGAPVACAEGVKDSWRKVAAYAAEQLTRRFGEAVRVEYYDLFDPDCPPLPPGAQLPLILVNEEMLSCGGKISTPAIRQRLELMGLRSGGHRD